MKRLLQINPVLRANTSTGRIMQEIGELAMSRGWESHIAYSKGRDGVMPCKSHLVPVGSSLSVALHGIETRLLDRHGLGSRLATQQFVERIKALNPDIIHIHNIHGYFLNYKILFRYLASCGKPVIWTVHDCWLYTGHCYYYSAAGCFKWKTGCGDCPQRGEFPRSMFRDRSAQNFRDKAEAFGSMQRDKFIIVPVSEWIASELRQSFLGGYDIRVLHNGIDTATFCPCPSDDIRTRYGLGNKHIILGLASIWMKEKGLDDFIQLADMTTNDEVIVMVGRMTPDQQTRLPKSIVTISRTDNTAQLAQLYSAATVFVNPTWQDNYPTVNLESIACGTPVITYRTGGSTEAVTEGITGFVVEQGNTTAIMSRVRDIKSRGKASFTAPCRDFALTHFRKEDRYQDYLDLYDQLLATKD